MEEQVLPQEAQPGAHGELEELVDGPDEGDVWRLVDDDYYRVADAEPDEDPEDVDPVKSALLWQYSIAKLSRQTVGVTPEQFAAIRRRTAARRAEMARAEQMKARNDAARNARPETTTSARPRTPKARRPSTRVNASTASPQPSPPEPDPAPAVAAITSAPATATPHASKPTRSARAVSDKPLAPHLRTFAHALADLLLADLLKYPPEKS